MILTAWNLSKVMAASGRLSATPLMKAGLISMQTSLTASGTPRWAVRSWAPRRPSLSGARGSRFACPTCGAAAGARMEMIRGRDGYRREEVRGEVEHGGARAARGADQFGQAIGAIDHEGAHPAQSGHVGRRRRLDRP